MRIRFIFIALVLVVGFGHAPESFGVDESVALLLPGNPLEGSRLFTGKGCLRCHAVYGVGGAAGPDLGQGILKRPLLEIAGVMWNHAPGMARVFQEQRVTVPQFKAPEMASLLSFLYYLGSLDPPGDAAAGARLFREKRCSTCHSLGGKGGKHATKLDSYSQYASPIYLTAGLWNHGKAMAGVMEALRVTRPTFEKNDIPDLLAYIRSVGGGVERVYLQPGNPQRGAKLFLEKRCIQCHSIKDQSGRVDLDLRARLKGSLMKIAGAMWNHGPKMWAKMAERSIQVPSLTTEEMSDLISYLYFLQFIDPPGNPQRGRTVHQEKRCGKCHSLPGAGGTVGPELAKVEKLKTPLEVVTEMWNHASTMEQKMLEESLEWPVFKGGEMADLMAYLLSLRKEASRPVGQKETGRKGG
ncbi:MAG: c-type cytochrome [Deltaproteobacteria bacterium]|nr:c-type cytochrome [Deltaproteobacteria bacterium]